MLKASFSHAEEDLQARALSEQRVEAARMIEALQAALAKDGEVLLSADERADISAAMNDLARIVERDNHLAIKEAIARLSTVTEDFAARRMDRSVADALRGRKLEDVKI